jgi:site-specific recombinase XerD
MTDTQLVTTEPGALVPLETLPLTEQSRTLPLPLDQNPAAVYLAGLSESGRRTMRAALDTVAGLVSNGRTDALGLDWAALRFQHSQAIRAKLAESYAPATANKMLSALRGTLKAAWKLGQMSAEDYHRAAAVEAVKGETLPAGRSISHGELQALMDVCSQDQSAAGPRDAAIMGLLYACGLRRAELVALDVDDYDVAAGELRVKGKRNKERLAHVVEGAAAALADWLTIRGDEPGPLFWPIRKGGHLKRGRLTTQAVYYILQARADQAGVKDLSPHDLRRTFVGDLLDAGADIATVQKLAGHANVATTARYDRRPEEAKRKAARLLHVPYRRRTLAESD